jgi:hypothetical protein
MLPLSHVIGVDNVNLKCVWDYDVAMSGVDFKDQKLQPYLLRW